jgi:hypothetical protein
MEKKEQTETMDILEINVRCFSMDFFYFADMQYDRELRYFLIGDIDDA